MHAGVRHYDETIESVMFVVVLVNSVTILAEVLYAESLRGEEARGARGAVQAVEFCFTLLYCVEMAVKMQALGAARYCALTPPSREPLGRMSMLMVASVDPLSRSRARERVSKCRQLMLMLSTSATVAAAQGRGRGAASTA